MVQSGAQPSPETVLPSSQASVKRMPSPQISLQTLLAMLKPTSQPQLTEPVSAYGALQTQLLPERTRLVVRVSQAVQVVADVEQFRHIVSQAEHTNGAADWNMPCGQTHVLPERTAGLAQLVHSLLVGPVQLTQLPLQARQLPPEG